MVKKTAPSIIETRSQKRRREIRESVPNRGGIEGLRESYRQAQGVYRGNMDSYDRIHNHIDYENRFRRSTVIPTRRFGFSEDMTIERLHQRLVANELHSFMHQAMLFYYADDFYDTISVQTTGYSEAGVTPQEKATIAMLIGEAGLHSRDAIIMRNIQNEFVSTYLQKNIYFRNGEDEETHVFDDDEGGNLITTESLEPLIIHMIVQCFCEQNEYIRDAQNFSRMMRIPKLDRILCTKDSNNNILKYIGVYYNHDNINSRYLKIDNGGLLTYLYNFQAQQDEAAEISKTVYLCLYQFSNLMIQLERYFKLTLGYSTTENVLQSGEDSTFLTLGYVDTFSDSQIEVDGLVFKSTVSGEEVLFVPHQNILELVSSFLPKMHN